MEGFNKLPKMQCFKEGGAVKSKYAGGGSCYKKGGHAESEEMSKDIAQDKSMVKRGVKQHEEALHKDEPKTKLKLKTGGKSKLVGKYKAGGSIKMKKDESDIKDIQKIKLTKTKKAEAPSPAMAAEATPFKKGGEVKKSVKKMADGTLTAPMPQGAISATEKLRLANRAKNRAMLSPIQQQELDKQELEAAKAAMAAGQKGAGLGGVDVSPMGKIMGRKKGGKAC